MHYLKKIDIYGQDIKFRLEHEERVKTLLGGLFTILTFALTIIFCWLLSADVIYRAKPIVYTENVMTAHSPEMILDAYNYPIGFVIASGSGSIINNASLFKIEVEYITYIKQPNGTTAYNKTILPLTNCSNATLPNITDPNILYTYSASKCIKDQNITIKGYWGEPDIRYLAINYLMCSNSSQNNNSCASPETIASVINKRSVNMNMYTISTAVSITNYTSPLSIAPKNPYKFAMPTMTKVTQFFLKQQTIQTDSGFFTESITNYTYVDLQEYFNDSYGNQANNLLVYFSLFSSKQREINHRSYIKITEIFGSLGGILKLMMMCFGFLHLPFSNIQKNIILTNHLNWHNGNNFEIIPTLARKSIIPTKIDISDNKILVPTAMNIKRIQDKDKERESEKNKENNEYNVSSIVNTPISIYKSSNRPLNISRKLRIIKKEAKKIQELNVLEITCLKIAKFTRCKKTDKLDNQDMLQRYNNYSEEIKKLFEISELFSQVQQINKLKSLLLEPEKLELFNILINADNDQFTPIQKSKMESFLEKQNKNALDIRLAKMINNRLIQI